MSKAYQTFLDALESKEPATRQVYDLCLKKYLERQQVRSADTLLTVDPKVQAENIRSFLKLQVENGRSASTQNQYINALRLFFVSNDIILNWDRIRMFVKKDDEESKVIDDPYKPEEIDAMFRLGDLRTQLCIGLMATGGLRVGALLSLRLRDLIPIDYENNMLYAIDVYARSKVRYWSFCTPQIAKLIDAYKGRRTEADSHLLLSRKKDPDDGKHYRIKSVDAIAYDIKKVAKQAGLRTVGSSPFERKSTMLDHGFRKYFRSTLTIAGIEQDNAEALLGHSVDLVRRYAKLDALQTFKACQYRKAIDLLTIKALAVQSCH